MRIAAVADVHIGNHKRLGGPLEAGLNNRCRLAVAALRSAYQMAHERSCEWMLICGDLFDTARTEPQVVRAVQDVVEEGRARHCIETVIIRGNHEMVTEAVGDHSLGPLRPVARVLDSPTRTPMGEAELWAVPFQPGKASEWLPATVEALSKLPSNHRGPRILMTHVGVQDGKTPPWLKEAHDSVHVELLEELTGRFGIYVAVTGNWHNPQAWGWDAPFRRWLHQVGTLCPTGFDNPGPEMGRMSVFGTSDEKPTSVAIPGPRFLTCEEDVRKVPKGSTIFLRVKEEVDMKELHAAGVYSVEVDSDTTDTQVALRTAAAISRSAENVEEAISGYVAQMPISDPELRPDVLARVKRFMGGA